MSPFPYIFCVDESSCDEEPLQFQPALDLARFKQFLESEQQAIGSERNQGSGLTQSLAERKLQEMLNMKPGQLPLSLPSYHTSIYLPCLPPTQGSFPCS